MKFAEDMKGKPVWKLRSATKDDLDTIVALAPHLPKECVEMFIEDCEGCSVVCEATVKGTKEGEGYLGRVLGAAVVDLSKELKNKNDEDFSGGYQTVAELMTVRVDKVMPDSEDVKQKLAMGCMKKSKARGCTEMRVVVNKDQKEQIDELIGYGFEQRSVSDINANLVANLLALSPDPQWKME